MQLLLPACFLFDGSVCLTELSGQITVSNSQRGSNSCILPDESLLTEGYVHIGLVYRPHLDLPRFTVLTGKFANDQESRPVQGLKAALSLNRTRSIKLASAVELNPERHTYDDSH